MGDEFTWYYAVAGEQQGPVSLATLRQLLLSGQVKPTDLVWNPSMTQWAAAQTVTALSATANAGVANLAAQQGYFPQPQQPAYLDYGLGAGAYAPPYAGFWLRFCAVFIDGLILGIPLAILQIMLEQINEGRGANPRVSDESLALFMAVVQVLTYWLYFALMESSAKQATLGKLAVGIKVITSDGARLSFARATGRHFAKFLSMLILYIGFVMAAFTRRKQALHDLIADTLVVKRR